MVAIGVDINGKDLNGIFFNRKNIKNGKWIKIMWKKTFSMILMDLRKEFAILARIMNVMNVQKCMNKHK